MGIGAALMEQSRFSPEGQPLTTTYLDYHVPMTADVPDVELAHLETPTPIIPGGFRGLGESGLIPPPAAILNAVAAAVPEVAAELTSIPLTADRLWGHVDRAGLTR